MDYWDPERGYYTGDDSGADYNWDTFFSTDYEGNQTPTDYYYTDSDWSFLDQFGGAPSLEQVTAAITSNSSQGNKLISGLINKFGQGVRDKIFNTDGSLNLTGIAGLASMAYKMFGDNSVKTAGWSQPVPKYSAYRQAVEYDDTNRRPGEGGRRYFSDIYYAPQGDAASEEAAAQKASESAAGIQALAPTYSAPTLTTKTIATPWSNESSTFRQATPSQALPMQQAQPMASVNEDTGGLEGFAAGGQVPGFRGQLQDKGFVIPGDVVAHADPMGRANKERGLRALHQNVGVEAIRGPGDAMSDSIPTTIDGREPARVANGEAYVPKENVQRMGNGNVDLGANRLYDIMDQLRKQRTGSTKQINPDNPQELRKAYGGKVSSMAAGGAVKSYSSDGIVTADPNATIIDTNTGSVTQGMGSSTMNTLSPYVGEYVTSALGKGAALADLPYQAYQGPLTAGASDLQQQAFAGVSNMASTGYTPTQFSGGLFDTQAAQQYMNPYLSAALDPQMKELKRQADIARLEDAGRLTKAGAYGGSRQAIMESEGRRNLLDKQNQALAQGYSTAYDKAMAQFNADQQRQMDAQKATEASRQYSAQFGRQSLADLAELGSMQRDIATEGIDADKAAFEAERDWMYKMPQYQLGLLSGIPIGGQASTPNTSATSAFDSKMQDLLSMLASLGVIDPNASNTTTGTSNTTTGSTENDPTATDPLATP